MKMLDWVKAGIFISFCLGAGLVYGNWVFPGVFFLLLMFVLVAVAIILTYKKKKKRK